MKRTLLALLTLLAAAFGAAQKEIVIAVGQGPTGFDPQNNNRSTVSGMLINIFDYLIMKDVNGEFEPALATSWEPVSDTAWRVTLREGVTWHDGTPFTAADVEFTFERVAGNPELVRHAYYAHIADVEVVNDHEVIFHTTRPDPIFPSNLSRNGASIIPRHYYEEVGVDRASQHPIGTGPYKFVENRSDDRLVLEAFDDYWGGRPAYDRAIFRVIPESSTAVSELITGGVQIVTGIPEPEVARVENSGAARVLSVGGNRTQHITFNTSEGQATADKRVRAAVDYAIDDALIVEVIQNGVGVPVQGRVSPETSLSPLELYDSYLYDPEQARALLAEAGYGENELTLTLMAATGYADMADLVAAMLNESGILTEIRLFEPSVFSSRYWNTGEFTHMAFSGSSDSSFDYGNSLIDLTCPDGAYSTRGHWCHEEFTDLVKRANAEFDVEVRAELLRQATEILLDERPQVYFYSSASFVGVSNDVEFTPRADSLVVLAETYPVTP